MTVSRILARIRLRRRRVRLEREKAPMDPTTRSLLRLLCAFVVLATASLAFPHRQTLEAPDLESGQIAEEEILAPFAFEVPKPREEFELERARAAEAVSPVFTRIHRAGLDHGAALARMERARSKRSRLAATVDSLGLRLEPGTIRYLSVPDSGLVALREARRILDLVDAQGLVGSVDAGIVKSLSQVQVNSPEGKEFRDTGPIFDPGRLTERAWADGLDRLGPRGAEVLVQLVEALARPNLAYDRGATEAERRAARENVSPIHATILKGERIVDANERITPDKALVLEALETALLQGVDVRGLRAWAFPLLGNILLVGVVLGLFGMYVRAFRPRIWNDLGALTLMTLIVLAVLALTGLVARAPGLDPLVSPVPFAAVVVSLLLGQGLAVGITVAVSLLVGTLSGWGVPVLAAGMVGGVIACYAVRNVVHRLEFLKSIVPIAGGMILVALGLALAGPGQPWSHLLSATGWLAANAAFSVALATFLLPLFEKTFGLASNITLLELSDLNRPIFKRMMLEANGTYHHSMIVGSLSEAAAERVGANPLLARVGGYYHDIGKIAKSVYFGENLREGLRNPHEKLTPHMSSLILESHVREGLELAREIGLPRSVAAFIPEHQGTTLMQYFFNKALEMDPEVEERDYRYPGPRPQSKETGLVMLADAAEATVRSLDDPSPKRIRAALDRLFEARFSDGQLDECGLTVADLTRVREAFTHVLSGVLHSRVKYPWQTAGGEQSLGTSRGARVFHPELETGIGSIEVPGEFASTPRGGGSAQRTGSGGR